MRKIIQYCLLAMTSIIGLLFFLSFSRLFLFPTEDGTHLILQLNQFFNAIQSTGKQLITLENWSELNSWMTDEALNRYTYSLKIIGISLLFTVIFGSLIAYAFMALPYQFRSKGKHLLNFFEGIPDLLVIFLMQMFLFILFRDFHIRILSMYGLAGKEPLLFPMIINSMLPSMFFAQFLIAIMEEEYEKHYILLGRAKGLSKFQLLFVHLTRNLVPMISIHFKTIIFMVLTNLVLVEYMFVLNGFTSELFNILVQQKPSPVKTFFYIGIFLLPIIVLERLITLLTNKHRQNRGIEL